MTARQRALPLFIGLVFSALVAALAVRCTSRETTPPGAVGPGPSVGAESAAPLAAAPSSATAEPASAPADARSAAEPAVGERDAGATTIGRLMQATDANDRSLLADIERKGEQAPDETVYELLELRRAGKPRAELERFIQSELKGGIAVRLIAMKWLRAIHGDPEPVPSGEPLLRGRGEPDPQPRTVKPLTKTAQ